MEPSNRQELYFNLCEAIATPAICKHFNPDEQLKAVQAAWDSWNRYQMHVEIYSHLLKAEIEVALVGKDAYPLSISNPQTINRYVYSRNNAVSIFDYTGLCGNGGDDGIVNPIPPPEDPNKANNNNINTASVNPAAYADNVSSLTGSSAPQGLSTSDMVFYAAAGVATVAAIIVFAPEIAAIVGIANGTVLIAEAALPLITKAAVIFVATSTLFPKLWTK